MLEVVDAATLERLLATLPCKVEAPATLRKHFSVGEILPTHPDDQRSCMRKSCFSKQLIQVWQTLPAIPRSASWETMLLLNLSRSGIGFLYHEQLYPQEEILLLRVDVALQYQVVRARKHNAMCYEIGARFTAKMNDE